MKELSPRAQRVLSVLCLEEAKKTSSAEILPEHVLLALLKSRDGIGFAALQYLKINVLTYQLALEQAIPRSHNPIKLKELLPGKRLRILIDAATIQARSLRRPYLGTEHLILGALGEEQSVTYHFFKQIGVTEEDVKSAIVAVGLNLKSSAFEEQALRDKKQKLPGNVQVFGAENVKDVLSSTPVQKNVKKKKKDTYLSEFGRDLTQAAQKGDLDPVIGREKEIARVIQILSRRSKNNPVLAGEPGTGKTAIVEGLAQRIANGHVPSDLIQKKLIVLDLALVIAGTKYRGEFEERIKRIVKEIKEAKNIILFIDELHTLVGAGGAEGSMDASNMLKPALSRGELQCIGATTLKEYRRYFEKDAALERRFQMVQIEETSVEETREILLGIKSRYERFHNVKYNDDVIDAVVSYSVRYISERYLPDKAIDLLDEAGAAKKIEMQNRKSPAILKNLEERVSQLTEKKVELVQNQDYEGAARIRDELNEVKSEVNRIQGSFSSNSIGSVTINDIAFVVSSITGIPVGQINESETAKLSFMEKELHKRVIGQNEAIKAVASAVRRSRAGVSSLKRPLGSFIFLGPTGVGKTLLAKTLSEFLFGSEKALVRIDMSDFMEKHNASRLVGAPPGYVGFEEGGTLTEQVRRRPYCVVLLDEIEKAHPDIFNLLLQILEEGELRDSLGHSVSFRNALVIMTSNAGAREISHEHTLGFGEKKQGVFAYEDIKTNALSELKRLMRPELLNRIDDILVFDTLSKKEISAILDVQIKELEQRLVSQSITLKLTKSARDYLIENGYDPQFGARPMRRLIQQEIEDPLSLRIIEGECLPCDKVQVSTKRQRVKGLSLKVIHAPREVQILRKNPSGASFLESPCVHQNN